MKEYVYLDMDLVNSYLAQLDEGILNKMVIGQNTADSKQEAGGETLTHTTKGAGSIGILNGSHEYSTTEIDKYNTVYSVANSELVETALADYSLDVLFDKLKAKNLLKEDTADWSDGSIIFMQDDFKVFNFEQLKKSVDKDNLDNVLLPEEKLDDALVELEKLTKTPQLRVKHKTKINEIKQWLKENDPYTNFRDILRFASYSEVLFPETILFKIGNSLSMCEKKNIRINNPILTFLSQTKRKANLLGIVIAKRDKKMMPAQGEQLPTEVIASAAPAIFTDIMLDSFELIDIGDYYIRPIAIYFDQE
ncbi:MULTISPECIES: DUF6414 family protein [Enterococcus]|uniref:DUF6414 family protein n=1 Tax=Enterococcus TaxID=1350 RepID=UPI000989A345|nr:MULTISPECIES: hypothetical protein [Enterococcus]MDN3048467.1 hypothetical protein [Enterococcus faecium]SJX69664.1 hypothetical protein FM130_06015 [Enterococcus faecium]